MKFMNLVQYAKHMTNKEKAEKIYKKLAQLFPTGITALNYKKPFELLVAVVLSAQTTDKQVNVVTADLFKKYKTVADYARIPLSEFEKDILRIGLYRAKAKNIKEAAKIISEKHKGLVPKMMDELTALPGVGRKTANVILGNLYGIYEGIAVDTHVTRLSQLFGLTKYKDPIKIERDLMEILPREEWFNFSNRLIFYGRKYCKASCKHMDCPLKKYIA